MIKLVPKSLVLGLGIFAAAVTLVCAVASNQTKVSAGPTSGTPFVTTEGCTSSAPCLSVINNGLGISIFGRATKNEGVEGVTQFNNSSTGSAFHNGVLGVDRSTSNNDYNDGVEGFSYKGTGVAGVTSFNSSPASAYGYGVIAIDASTTSNKNSALYAYSTNNNAIEAFTQNNSYIPAIFGVSSGTNSSTIAIEAQANQGLALLANSSGSYGASTMAQNYGLVAGTIAPTGSIAASGIANSVISVDTDNVGVMGQAAGIGVLALGEGPPVPAASRQHPALFALCVNGGPAFITGTTLSDPTTYKSEMDCAGDLTIAGRLTTGQSPMVAAKTSSGANLVTYGSRQAQPTVEDVGEAKLVDGHAYVKLDPAFSSTIDHKVNYLVFLTPEGDSRGLFVSNRTTGGFSVGENQGGRSMVAFSYRIVAKPYGDNAPRLPTDAAVKRALQMVPQSQVSVAKAIAPLHIPSVPHHALPKIDPLVPRLPSTQP